MKIAYLTKAFYSVSETFIRDLAVGLSASGHEVHIISDQVLPGLDAGKVDSICALRWSSSRDRIHTLIKKYVSKRIGYRFEYQMNRWMQHQSGKRLKGFLCGREFDVIYLDYGTVAVEALGFLEKAQIPYVVHFHGYDITHSLRDGFYRDQLNKVFHSASALIANTEHLRRLLILEGAPYDKVVKVPMGVNANLHKPMDWRERRKCAPTVAFLGRLTPKKNPVALVEAFAIAKREVPEARLVIIGDGPERVRVEQRVHGLGLSKAVTLYGALPQKDALDIVNQSWIYAQHSVTPFTGDQESFGLSLAEAATLELPVVSTRHNGIPENVVDGSTGFLCNEYDYGAMAKHLVRLLKDPTLAQQMGEAGRRHVKENFDMSNRVERILSILQDCANSFRGP
jgi:colanic acid/amylovoran biosynthesis glycosyltransferase